MRRSISGNSESSASFSRSETKSMRARGCRSRSFASSGDASTMLPMPQGLSTRIFFTLSGGASGAGVRNSRRQPTSSAHTSGPMRMSIHSAAW